MRLRVARVCVCACVRVGSTAALPTSDSDTCMRVCDATRKFRMSLAWIPAWHRPNTASVPDAPASARQPVLDRRVWRRDTCACLDLVTPGGGSIIFGGAMHSPCGGCGVGGPPVDLNQVGQLDSPEWSPAGHPGMQQQEPHSTIEQHRAAQWAGSINQSDKSWFTHFKVAKYRSNNRVKWQVLLAANWQQTRTSHRRRSAMGDA